MVGGKARRTERERENTCRQVRRERNNGCEQQGEMEGEEREEERERDSHTQRESTAHCDCALSPSTLHTAHPSLLVGQS